MIRTFFILAFFFSCSWFINAQSAFTSTGGDAAGIGGSVAYSIGQPGYTNFKSDAGQISLGVQQAYLSIMVSSDEPEPIFQAGLFPNPVRDELFLSVQSSFDLALDEYSYRVVDISGREFMKGKIQSGITNLPVPDLQEGLYFLQILCDGISKQTFKVIKTQ